MEVNIAGEKMVEVAPSVGEFIKQDLILEDKNGAKYKVQCGRIVQMLNGFIEARRRVSPGNPNVATTMTQLGQWLCPCVRDQDGSFLDQIPSCIMRSLAENLVEHKVIQPAALFTKEYLVDSSNSQSVSFISDGFVIYPLIGVKEDITEQPILPSEMWNDLPFHTLFPVLFDLFRYTSPSGGLMGKFKDLFTFLLMCAYKRIVKDPIWMCNEYANGHIVPYNRLYFEVLTMLGHSSVSTVPTWIPFLLHDAFDQTIEACTFVCPSSAALGDVVIGSRFYVHLPRLNALLWEQGLGYGWNEEPEDLTEAFNPEA